jgi:hypothetical protein
MRLTRVPLVFLVSTFVLFVVGNVSGWVTHDPQSAGDWGGGGSAALLAVSVALFCFSLVGCLIASRQPRNAIGWILIAIGFLWALDSALEGYALYGLVTNPGSLPGARWANALDEWLWVVSVGLMGTFLFQLFPDGRLPSRRWRPLAYLSGAALVLTVASDLFLSENLPDSVVPASGNPFAPSALDGIPNVAGVSLALLLACIPASAVVLLIRYWHSSGVARLQMKWLVSATTAIVIFYSVIISVSGGSNAPAWLVVAQDAAVVSFCLIPLSIGAAVLRYRLYEIDVIVRRTVVYTVLVGMLVVVYLGSVSALGWVGREVTGQSGALAVTLSTLLVAVSFQPLRKRIQNAVDRRFYRRRYDANSAASAFSNRLRAEIDLEALTHELLGVIDETLQPSHAAVWLRGPDHLSQRSPSRNQPVVLGRPSR